MNKKFIQEVKRLESLSQRSVIAEDGSFTPNAGRDETKLKKRVNAVRSFALNSLIEGNGEPLVEYAHSLLFAFAKHEYSRKGAGVLVCPGIHIDSRYEDCHARIFFAKIDEVEDLPCLMRDGKMQCLKYISEYRPAEQFAIVFIFDGTYSLLKVDCPENPMIEPIMQEMTGILQDKDEIEINDPMQQPCLRLTTSEINKSNWNDFYFANVTKEHQVRQERVEKYGKEVKNFLVSQPLPEIFL